MKKRTSTGYRAVSESAPPSQSQARRYVTPRRRRPKYELSPCFLPSTETILSTVPHKRGDFRYKIRYGL